MDIKTAIRDNAIKLKRAGIEQFNMESRILLKHVTHRSEVYLFSHLEEELSTNLLDLLEVAIDRRSNFEPIAYITCQKEFYGRDFFVDHNVLIPRPDSEILIDAVLSSNKDEPRILDLGTGSGCLIITLMLELSNATGFAIDVKKEAIEIAKKNAARYEVNVNFRESNWFDSLKVGEKFDIIISNPPYISRNSDRISKETLLHEPHGALFSDNDGLKDYEIIAANVGGFLCDSGAVYLEIGYDQERKVIEIYKEAGFVLERKYLDLSGITRCLKFCK